MLRDANDRAKSLTERLKLTENFSDLHCDALSEERRAAGDLKKANEQLCKENERLKTAQSKTEADLKHTTRRLKLAEDARDLENETLKDELKEARASLKSTAERLKQTEDDRALHWDTHNKRAIEVCGLKGSNQRLAQVLSVLSPGQFRDAARVAFATYYEGMGGFMPDVQALVDMLRRDADQVKLPESVDQSA